MAFLDPVIAPLAPLAPLGTCPPPLYQPGSQAGRLGRLFAVSHGGAVRGQALAGCRAGARHGAGCRTRSKVRAPAGRGRVHIRGKRGAAKGAKWAIMTVKYTRKRHGD